MNAARQHQQANRAWTRDIEKVHSQAYAVTTWNPWRVMRESNGTPLLDAEGNTIRRRIQMTQERAFEHCKEFVEDLGPNAYAYVGIGQGEGGEWNAHFFIGGVWKGRGRQFRDVARKQVTKAWKHGKVRKCEPYDPAKGARSYVPDRHDMWIIGTPRPHNAR